MNKMDILESMYETIYESMDWGVECKDNSYGEFISGVICMTDKLLEKEKMMIKATIGED